MDIFPSRSAAASYQTASRARKKFKMIIRIFLAIIAILIGLWFRKRKQHFEFFKKLNIPGPEPNIIVGNLLEMNRKNPVETHHEWIKKYGRVVGYFCGYRPVLLVTDADLLKQILIKDFSDFVDRSSPITSKRMPPPDSKGLNQAYGKEWKEIRSIMTPAFTTSKLKMMSPQMTDSIDSFVDVIRQKAVAGQEFNIYEHYQALTFEVICRTAFGVHKNFQNNLNDPLLDSVKRIFRFRLNIVLLILACFPGITIFMIYIRNLYIRSLNKGRNPFEEMTKASESIIKLRRADPSARRPDLLQHLLDAQRLGGDLTNVNDEHLTAGDEADRHAEETATKDSQTENGVSPSKKGLDDETITMNTFVMLAAGYETTSNTLASATLLMVNYQDVQEKVRREIQEVIKQEGKLDYTTVQKMKYLDCVISEALRLYPPVHSIVTREAAVDKQYGNIKIPKGLLVQVPTKVIQLDPEYWPDPQKFNPDRFLPENKHNINPLAFQAFGAGPRNCVGMRFAQMEMKLALARVLEKFRFVASDKTESDPPEVEVDFGFARLKGVYLRAVPI